MQFCICRGYVGCSPAGRLNLESGFGDGIELCVSVTWEWDFVMGRGEKPVIEVKVWRLRRILGP